MHELVATGSTVDEAVDSACAQLGLTRDDVTYEIIDMPQKKLFGTSPAKVAVKPLDENFVMAENLSEQEPKTEKKTQPIQRARTSKPSREKREEPAWEPEKFDAAAAEQPETEIALEDLSSSARTALDYLKEITVLMGAPKLSYRFFQTERGVKFAVDGEDSALVIGRRGDTMEALQYLCMLVSSRTENDYSRVMLDVAGYRGKREKTLQALAAREAARVKKTQYNQTLEPMNPYERRIVHSTIQQIEGVKSESVGNEPYRRVVISLISGGKGNRGRRDGDRRGDDRRPNGGGQGRRDYGGRGRQGNDRNRGPRPQRPESQTVPSGPAPERAKSDVDPSKLYGKIDI